MRYGLLTYRNTANLGDEIQSIAARRFLPRVDELVMRDYIAHHALDDADPLALICNGWFSHRPENWPPPPGIVPLLVSVHLADPAIPVGPLREPVGRFMLEGEVAEYLRAWGPVGARDLSTLAQLEAADIPAYFSGCLTLTLERTVDDERSEAVLLVDLPDAAVEHIRASTTRELDVVTHRDEGHGRGDERMRRAEHLLERYQRAHCVITSRLHAALPCLAYDTPVLVVRPERDVERFDGLDALFRSVSLGELLDGGAGFDVDDPAPNDLDHLRFRDLLIRTVTTWITGLERGDRPASGPAIGAAEREATLWALLAASQEDRAALRAALQAAHAEIEALRASRSRGRRWRDRARSITRRVQGPGAPDPGAPAD